MRADVDQDLCQAYGVCAQLAPTVFELDDDGYAHVPVSEEAVSSVADKVREAVQSCPVQAVLVDESD